LGAVAVTGFGGCGFFFVAVTPLTPRCGVVVVVGDVVVEGAVAGAVVVVAAVVAAVVVVVAVTATVPVLVDVGGGGAVVAAVVVATVVAGVVVTVVVTAAVVVHGQFPGGVGGTIVGGAGVVKHPFVQTAGPVPVPSASAE
jgi:hypothetical protein